MINGFELKISILYERTYVRMHTYTHFTKTGLLYNTRETEQAVSGDTCN